MRIVSLRQALLAAFVGHVALGAIPATAASGDWTHLRVVQVELWTGPDVAEGLPDAVRQYRLDALASTAAAKELGLVGVGTITLAPSVGVMQRETYKQNEGRNGVDPATGQPLVALYPQQFDLTWWDHRIGGWVQHFRPDVFAEAKALADERARISSTNMSQVWKDAKADAARQAEHSSDRTIA